MPGSVGAPRCTSQVRQGPSWLAGWRGTAGCAGCTLSAFTLAGFSQPPSQHHIGRLPRVSGTSLFAVVDSKADMFQPSIRSLTHWIPSSLSLCFQWLTLRPTCSRLTWTLLPLRPRPSRVTCTSGEGLGGAGLVGGRCQAGLLATQQQPKEGQPATCGTTPVMAAAYHLPLTHRPSTAPVLEQLRRLCLARG